MNEPILSRPVRFGIEIAVYLLLIFGIIGWCLQILSPFLGFIVWGVIIAVSVHTPYLKMRAALGNRGKLAMTLFIIMGLGVIIAPVWLFGDSLLSSAQDMRQQLQSGEVQIPAANERVKNVPVVGEKLYNNWSDAASNFSGWLNEHGQQARAVADAAIHKVTGLGMTVLQFIAATLIAALFLAHAKASEGVVAKFFQRLAGPMGDEMQTLAVSTIRSVTVGVLGIAAIQAFLGGLGMVLMDVPAAGFLALLILVVAVAQLPPWLVLLPVIFYVFSTQGSSAATIIFAIWSIIVSFADMALKPMFLGRGVEAPMPVILLGAIGGLIHSGIVGLFIGAVVLAIGYKLVLAWFNAGRIPAEPPSEG